MEKHQKPAQPQTNTNVFTIGSIAGHNVVIAGLPAAGNNPAATVVTEMKTTLPNLKFVLLVGIGGGVPVRTDNETIRDGHVVVSKPTGLHSGAIQYDHGKAWTDLQFERAGFLRPPPTVLLNAAQLLAAERDDIPAEDDPVVKNVCRISRLPKYKYPSAEHDHLYPPNHIFRLTALL